MGEHQTWFDLLRNFDWFRSKHDWLQHKLGWSSVPVTGEASHFTINHVLIGMVVIAFILIGARSFKKSMNQGEEAALVPPAKWNLRLVFEVLCDAVFNFMLGVFGTEEKVKKYFPFIASIAIFILFSNFMALIPGFAPATDTLKTNLMLGGLVFFMTHYWGVKENGMAYLKHFMGPVLVLAPLFFVIELISHIARPFSLALRLLGNMAADHKVLFTFFFLVPLLVPVPFYFLGILVCVVQALVFSLLSMVYISMAVAHDH